MTMKILSYNVAGLRAMLKKEAFIDFVGNEPKKFVSPIAARLLAGSAFNRAQQLTTQYPNSDNLIGLACSASIATNRPKRGSHHAWIVTWQKDKIVQAHIDLAKGMRSRAQEETLVSNIMLNLLAQACGLPYQISLELLEKDEWVGLVMGNNGKDFCVGANIGVVGIAAAQGMFDQVEKRLKMGKH